MSDGNNVSGQRPSHMRQRLPRKSKANHGVSIENTTVTGPKLPERSINVLSQQEHVPASSTSDKKFEFVTLTSGPSKITTRQISKTVRKQAMNDYIRKQTRQVTTGIVETVNNVRLEEPSRYKGKFKLDTWSHKTKTKAILARRSELSKDNHTSSNEEEVPNAIESSSTLTLVNPWHPIDRDVPLPRIFSPSASLDPFDTLAVRLGPRSENLLAYYNTQYLMNSVAINAESNFFSFVKTDPALFHSILYLVALYRDIKCGLIDSAICLYHGSEAFRIINERLENEFVFDDATIAAVAMLVNKENLNGKYELSKMHMRGLKQMIQTRGGPQNLSGVFRRIVTWSDFCFANVWNIQPSFPRLTYTPLTSPIPTSSHMIPGFSELKASHLFGPESPIIPIISNLRTLTHLLPPSQIPLLPTRLRIHASNIIYTTEYSLLSLNQPSPAPSSFSFCLSSCAFTFESLPLRIALHLYLYLSIRYIPTTSELVYSMMLRLKDSLEQIGVMGWWESEEERKGWLLWVLWVGCVTAREGERWWFLRELGRLCVEMEILGVEELKERLKRAVWEDEWCGEMVGRTWQDLVSGT